MPHHPASGCRPEGRESSASAGPGERRGAAGGRELRGVVVEESGLALPGATIELARGGATVSTTETAADGSFTLVAGDGPGDLVVRLAGFETARVPAESSTHVVLAVAHAS